MNEPDSHEPNKEQPQRADLERRALLLDTDLFFSVKVTTMLKHIGMATTTVRQTQEWSRWLETERFDVALVNTGARGVEWRQAIELAHTAGLPIIAYASHIDLETQAEARAAGATRVIANSKMASDLPTIIEQTLERANRTSGRVATESSSEVTPDRDSQDDGA